MKNTTLLLKKYELGHRITRPIINYISPLFQIKSYYVNPDDPLNAITNNKKFTYTPIKLKNKKQGVFDRILVLHSLHQSNARRSVFVNKLRDRLIQFINRNGNPNTLYSMTLNQICEIVPENLIIEQMRNMERKMSKKKMKGVQNIQQTQTRGQKLWKQVLFPFNNDKWTAILNQQMSRSKSKSFRGLKQNFLYLELCNIYKLHCSNNRQYLYQDICDFTKMLDKFNFIRFFWQNHTNNEFMAQKYSEKLIKSIKWRSQESEEYLLLLIRNNTWQRFVIALENFLHIYQLTIQAQNNQCDS